MSTSQAPTQFAGFALEQRRMSEPLVRTVFGARLSNGSRVAARFLNWRLEDFVVEELGPIEGWFRTIELSIDDCTFVLEQGTSSFYASPHSLGYDVECDAPVSSSARHPTWRRRSDRHWPVLDGTLLPFLFQFETSEDIVYLFGDFQRSIVAAYVDSIGTKDVEDHYDQEEARRDET